MKMKTKFGPGARALLPTQIRKCVDLSHRREIINRRLAVSQSIRFSLHSTAILLAKLSYSVEILMMKIST